MTQRASGYCVLICRSMDSAALSGRSQSSKTTPGGSVRIWLSTCSVSSEGGSSWICGNEPSKADNRSRVRPARITTRVGNTVSGVTELASDSPPIITEQYLQPTGPDNCSLAVVGYPVIGQHTSTMRATLHPTNAPYRRD